MSKPLCAIDQEQLNKLYRYGLSLSNNEDEAYDLLQSCLEKYLQQQGNNPIKAPLAYIRTMMRNQYIDLLRHRNKYIHAEWDSVADEMVSLVDSNSLDDIMIRESELAFYWGKLTDAEREIVYLWAVEELTAAEMATIMSIPRGTVLSRIHRLKKKLRTIAVEQEAMAEAGGVA